MVQIEVYNNNKHMRWIQMDDKEWYKSKTVWAGLIIAGYGIVTGFGVDLSAYTELIISVASAFGIVGIRQAIGKKK